MVELAGNRGGRLRDYGSYPDQQRRYFTLRDARNTLAVATNVSGLEGQIYAGLESLTQNLFERPWQRDDSAAMRIERCLIDANWGQSTDVVYQFCRQSRHASVVMPSHGKFVGASSQCLTERERKPGERFGLNWVIPLSKERRGIQYMVYDTNYWKSFIHARLAVAMGNAGCLSLFGDNTELHRMFAEHLSAEYRVPVTGRGRIVDEWRMRPEHGDNHWFDGVTGCAVAALMQGSNLEGVRPVQRPGKTRYVDYSELYREARGLA
ncbi:MAG TPA: terminase gpA endonuclease subunit [Gemmataceae bacterium]|nr:terminase gpA endonuclease subunit [Gemmataceae bacterium]